MKSSKPVIYVVDDDASMRKALNRLLSSVGFKTRLFADPAVFLKERSGTGPQCLILDIMMPGLSGLDVQAELKSISSSIPIVFITGHGTVPTSVRALKEGAVDFLEKPFEDEALLAAIRQALSRHREILADDEENAEARQNFATLTSREQEVMALTVKGLLNKEIGNLLDIAEKTVKVHRGRVMKKMQADSLADLVLMVERAALL